MNRREFLKCAAALAAPRLAPSIVGANTAIAGFSLEQAISTLREVGFKSIEIHPMGVPEAVPGRFPGFEFDQIADSEKARIRRMLAGFERITTHLPYIGMRFFTHPEAASEASIQKLKIAMEATRFFGAELAVMHVTAPGGWTLEQAWPHMLGRFRELGDLAARGNFRLGLETGYPNSVREFVRLIREIDHERVGCTIDVGHQSRYKELVARVKPEERSRPESIRAYNDVTLEIVDQLREKIFHFHVHDIDPATWKEHKPLGSGFVQYGRLIPKLEQIGYRGLLILEINAPDMKTALADSKRRMEDHLAAAGSSTSWRSRQSCPDTDCRGPRWARRGYVPTTRSRS